MPKEAKKKIETKVEEITGQKRDEFVNEILSDERVKKLLEKHKATPQTDKADVRRSTFKDKTYRILYVPVEMPKAAHESYLLYSERTDKPRLVRTTSEEGLTATATSKRTIETDEVEDGVVKSRRDDLTEEDANKISSLQASATGNISTQASLPCLWPDTGCIQRMAEAYAEEVVVCGSCVASSGWLVPSCAACVAALIEEGLNFCNPC